MTCFTSGASSKCVTWSNLRIAAFTFNVMVSCMNAMDSGTFYSPGNGRTMNWSGSGDYFIGHSGEVISISGTAASGNWSTMTYLGITISGVDSSTKFTVKSKGTYTSTGTVKSNEISISPTSTSSSVTSIYCNATISLTKAAYTATTTFYLELNKAGGGSGGMIPDGPQLQ